MNDTATRSDDLSQSMWHPPGVSLSVSLTNVTLLRYCPCPTPAPGHSPCHSPKFVTAWSSLLTLTDTGPGAGTWHRTLNGDSELWYCHTVNRSRLGCGGTHRTQHSALSWNSDTETEPPATLETSPARQLGNNFTASHDSNWAQPSNSTPNFGIRLLYYLHHINFTVICIDSK